MLGPNADLRNFLAALTAKKELRRVAAPTNPHLEMAALTQRVSRTGGMGQALLFEQPVGSAWRVATNLFGTPRRAALAWGVDAIETLVCRLRQDLDSEGNGPGGQRLASLLEQTAFWPSLTGEPCWSPAPGATLAQLPALTAWPGDGGPYLTLPVVVTRHPQTGQVNYGLYRLQLLDPRRAAIHWNPGAGAAEHHRAWADRGLDLPVALVLGGPPALLAAAAMPLPAQIDEAALAGYLSGAALSCTPGPLTGLPLAIGAEIVLEGVISATERALEGPFGNFSGRYVPPSPQPVFQLQALYHRPDPILPATVVGPPPMEDCYLAQINSRLLCPLWSCDHPALLDVHFPLAGIFHGAALLSVPEGEGAKVIRQLWQTPPFSRSRLLVACPPEIDIRRPDEVYWHALNGFELQYDLLQEGRRLGLDASRVRPGAPVQPDAATAALVQRRWQEYFPDES